MENNSNAMRDGASLDSALQIKAQGSLPKGVIVGPTRPSRAVQRVAQHSIAQGSLPTTELKTLIALNIMRCFAMHRSALYCTAQGSLPK